ncbi:MAG: hypothetical protein IPO08_18495 [Xanthomonadales bacterium]|nr:hypothetical protein [Xanthomonadales bacterium]
MSAKRVEYRVRVIYKGADGFKVTAASPEQAIEFVRSGDPNDASVPGERQYDQYIDVIGYVVTDADGVVLHTEGVQE